MKRSFTKLSLTALALTGSALTSCIVPGGYDSGPRGQGSGYNGGYRQASGSYVQDAEYEGQSDDGRPDFEEDGGEIVVLPVGAVYVFEGGERHWYYQGHCYRSGPRGYVSIHRRTVVHHDEHREVHRDVRHDDDRRNVQPQHHEEHRVEEHRIVQQPHHDEHHEEKHEEHHEALIQKNGHTYRKGSDGKLILVK